MAFTFYYTIDAGSVRDYMPSVPVLIPASSWANRNGYKGLPAKPRLPAHITEIAVDPGGFVFTMIQKRDYPFSDAELVEFATAMGAQWCATKDYCCEPEITENQGIVCDRQHKTTDAAVRIWGSHKDAPFAWVPTVQGWEVDDYRTHARALRPLVEEMSAYYQDRDGEESAFRVGIGTLCRRASPAMIRRVVMAVAQELPNVGFHLWGVKLTALRPNGKQRAILPLSVKSADSAAWNGFFGRDHEKWKGSGKRKLQYAYEDAMPEYGDKVERAVSQYGQLPLL